MTAEERKERDRVYRRKYMASPKGIAYYKNWISSGRHAEWYREYKKTDKYKQAALLAQKKYRSSDLYKARMEKAEIRRTNSRNYWRHALKVKYGLSEAAYEKMFREQNGCCAICSSVNLNGRRLSVDHNHATRKVRALLCDACNVMIARAKENILILYKAADYLEKHNGPELAVSLVKEA